MKKGRSMTFAEARKHTGPLAFSAMVKPIGSTCNLDCQYCYYLDKAQLYSGHQPVMSDELLERYIEQYISANDVPIVTFVWHGGEPLLAGIEFYRKAIALQKKYANGKEIENSIQTNGTLVNQEWCAFFADNKFLVGLSIDGPRDIHDAYRQNRAGSPTFDKVMEAAEMFKRFGVEFNTLSVINNLSVGRGVEVYRFMKSIGSHYMQFLPAVEHVAVNTDASMTGKRALIVPPLYEAGSMLAEWSVSAEGYGEFMNDIFDEWVVQDVGSYYVQLFDAALAQWYGVQPGLCALCDTCGDSLVVEHNGDVYSCDHFVYPEYRLGNINQTSLRELFRSKAQFDFGLNKRNLLPEECRICRYFFACRGECPKHRFDPSQSGENTINALCEGYKRFFKHVDPYMKQMAELLHNRQTPASIMTWARQRMGLM